jgi:2-dehydropantoate 2-reductase
VKAVVVGAGGLGSFVGAVLAQAGHDVWLVIRGAHRQAVEERGLTVRSDAGDFVVHPRCVASAQEVDGADVVLVAVKAYSLDEVAPQIVAAAEAGSVVLSLLNGVDTAERLARRGAPEDRLVDGVAYLTAFRTAPGEIQRKGLHGRLVLGSSLGHAGGAVKRVAQLFGSTGIDVVVADDVRIELWEKMAVVCSLSVICCLTDAPVGPIRAHPLGADFQARAIAEVLDVGRGRGVPIPPASDEKVGAVLDGFPEDFYPSVLHDLRSGHRTEMDQLAGVLTRLGREAGVETPLLDAATVAVRIEEDRRRSE